MTEITTVGVDLAKSVFQVHGVDAEGAVVLRRQLRRNQMLEFFQRLAPCLVGIEPGLFTEIGMGRLRAPESAVESSC